jgi:hypothetical protein
VPHDRLDPNVPWDDGDEQASVGGHDESFLDSLTEYVRADDVDDFDDPWDVPQPSRTIADDGIDTLLVTATNPAGTVSATALMSGQVVRVALSAQVTRMTEFQLAEEISVISNLARQQAQATQHAFVATFMHQQGHDPAGTRGFLESVVGLPSPQTVLADRAALFATRYSDEIG